MALMTIARTSSTVAGVGTVATVIDIAAQPVSRMKKISVRLEVTTAIGGTNPTLDIYLQRSTQPDPGADDWDDIYHFPQQTDAGVSDYVVDIPAEAERGNILRFAGHNVVQERIPPDHLLTGFWGNQIRIREVLTGTNLTAAVYNIHLVGF